MKTATATLHLLAAMCASFLLMAAVCTAHADDLMQPLEPIAIAPYGQQQRQDTGIINPARTVTDVNTGRSVTIVPVLPAYSNPGMAVYMDQTTGQEITVIENTYGAR